LIQASGNRLCLRLAAAHAYRDWSTLGYASFEGYVRDQFGVGRAHAYRLLDKAKVLALLADAAGIVQGEMPELPERAVRRVKADLPAVAAAIRAGTERKPARRRPSIVTRATRAAGVSPAGDALNRAAKPHVASDEPLAASDEAGVGEAAALVVRSIRRLELLVGGDDVNAGGAVAYALATERDDPVSLGQWAIDSLDAAITLLEGATVSDGDARQAIEAAMSAGEFHPDGPGSRAVLDRLSVGAALPGVVATNVLLVLGDVGSEPVEDDDRRLVLPPNAHPGRRALLARHLGRVDLASRIVASLLVAGEVVWAGDSLALAPMPDGAGQ
jgi:hypothetical protein